MPRVYFSKVTENNRMLIITGDLEPAQWLGDTVAKRREKGLNYSQLVLEPVKFCAKLHAQFFNDPALL